MAIKLTESRLRQIIREEASRLTEMGKKADAKRSGKVDRVARVAGHLAYSELGDRGLDGLMRGEETPTMILHDYITDETDLEPGDRKWDEYLDATMAEIQRLASR